MDVEDVLQFEGAESSVIGVLVECGICMEDSIGCGFSCVRCGFRCCAPCLERAFATSSAVSPTCPRRSCGMQVPRCVLVRLFGPTKLDAFKRQTKGALVAIEKAKMTDVLPCAEMLAALSALDRLASYYDEHGVPDACGFRTDVERCKRSLRARCPHASPSRWVALRFDVYDEVLRNDPRTLARERHVAILYTFAAGHIVQLWRCVTPEFASDLASGYRHWARRSMAGRQRIAVAPTENRTYRCPSDGCEGYVSVRTWRCMTCASAVCSACLVTVDRAVAHVCDPGAVLSIRLVRAHTKPCPKCAFRIARSEGCDVMFCTQCHTAFLWSSGAVVRGDGVHNPHYFAWLDDRRRRGEAVPDRVADLRCDDGCGPVSGATAEALASLGRDDAFLAAYAKATVGSGTARERFERELYDLLDLVARVGAAAQPKHNVTQGLCPVCGRDAAPRHDANLDVRAALLAGTLSEPGFARVVYSRWKLASARIGEAQVRQLFATVAAGACDAFVRVGRRPVVEEVECFLKLVDDVRVLRVDCDAKFDELARTFHIQAKRI